MPFRNRTHSDDYPVSGLQSLTFGRHFKILLGSNLSININFCSKKEARIRLYLGISTCWCKRSDLSYGVTAKNRMPPAVRSRRDLSP
ncbi:uncharacterized protein DFL_005820 [Arthrobotrys flagrans]|uniref:Uncharacterized protein n=1 Tax=Arthrobotrys flagrans TaxID=97331 RepID=A0A436ZYF4_ARTFL|nr:hypothetical protein DFL_005820 [Arthrobotrys flagrans]